MIRLNEPLCIYFVEAIGHDRGRPSRKRADRIAEITGVPADAWKRAAHTSTVATQNNSVISTVDSPLVDVRGQEG